MYCVWFLRVPQIYVQRQQCIHQIKLWNILNVNNKDARTTSVTSFWCLIVNFEDISCLFLVFMFLILKRWMFSGTCCFEFVSEAGICYNSWIRISWLVKVLDFFGKILCYCRRLSEVFTPGFLSRVTATKVWIHTTYSFSVFTAHLEIFFQMRVKINVP